MSGIYFNELVGERVATCAVLTNRSTIPRRIRMRLPVREEHDGKSSGFELGFELRPGERALVLFEPCAADPRVADGTLALERLTDAEALALAGEGVAGVVAADVPTGRALGFFGELRAAPLH